MIKHKLSARAWEILLLIDEHCDHTGRFWVPSAYEQWIERLGRTTWVWGGGDAQVIKSLWRRGLAKEKTLAHYASQITEDGRMLIEDGLANGAIPLKLRD